MMIGFKKGRALPFLHSLQQQKKHANISSGKYVNFWNMQALMARNMWTLRLLCKSGTEQLMEKINFM